MQSVARSKEWFKHNEGIRPRKKMQDMDNDKRLRVGDFRVRFTEDANTLSIHSVNNRKDAYR